MKPDIKKKWVHALRSDVFAQGQSTLKTMHEGQLRYCCLGVLCEVLGVEWDTWPSNHGTVYSTDSQSSSLGHEMLDEIEMTNDQMAVLISMNDQHRNTFHDIADYIEENL